MSVEALKKIWPDWQLEEKPIGKGSFGVVYKAIRRDNGFVSYAAIKEISVPNDPCEVDTLRAEGLDLDGTRSYFQGIVDGCVSEIQLMESLKAMQNIVSVEDYKVVEKVGEIGWDIYIRMELLTPFNTYIRDKKKLTEKEVIKLGRDICTALERCAMKDIIHRDIKPENIFINSFGDFKLGDFGIARKLENMSDLSSKKGTVNYMAPEVAHSYNYDARVDIYSLGIVLYRLLNKNRPPFIENDSQLLNPHEREIALARRMKGDDLPAPCEASPAMADLILRACAYDPKDRFSTAAEMNRALMCVKHGSYNTGYNIAFDANGGSGSMPTIGAIYGVARNLPENTFTRNGYTFAGWNLSQDGSSTAFGERSLAENLSSDAGSTVTLYAQWKPIRYYITFNANGGSGDMSATGATYGIARSLPANTFTRNGYAFVGWNLSQDGSGTAFRDYSTVNNLSSASGSTVTLYAQWKPIRYYIAFNANGGSGSMPTIGAIYGVAKTLPANTFTRSGYAFTGWNLTQDGSGTGCMNNSIVSNLGFVEDSTVTLYAQWKHIVKNPLDYIKAFVSGLRSDKKKLTVTASVLAAILLISAGAFTVPKLLDRNDSTKQEKTQSKTSSDDAGYSKPEKELIASIISEADELVAENDYEGALDVIQKGLETYPKSFTLQAYKESLPVSLLSVLNTEKMPYSFKADEPFSMVGLTYSHGFTCMGYGEKPYGNETLFKLNGEYSSLSFTAGIVESNRRNGDAVITFYADGEVIYKVQLDSRNPASEHVIDVTECKELKISVYDGYWIPNGSGTYGLADLLLTK